MSNRSTEYIDLMKANLAGAEDLANRNTTAAIASYPPDYIAGLKMTIDSNGQLVVGIGSAYVAGRSIRQNTAYVADGKEWLTPRVADKFYYVYLTDDGLYYIDATPPELVSTYFGYYHPMFAGYRNIGKVFLDSSSIFTYAATGNPNEYKRDVVVAALGYGGDADYECDGVEDDVEINRALAFIDGAYSGGTVSLTEGTFDISASIVLSQSNVIFRGTGWNTILKRGAAIQDVITGSATAGTEVRDLAIDGNIAVYAPGTYYGLLCSSGGVRAENVHSHDNTTWNFKDVTGGCNRCKASSVAENGSGFTGCTYMTRCVANNLSDGFYTCHYLTNCEAIGCVSDGFQSCLYLSVCLADACTDGFQDCDHISVSLADTCTAVGFNACEHIAASYADTCGTDGFSNCNNVTGGHAVGCGDDGFDTCGHMSACHASACDDDGFVDCRYIVNCHSENNTGWGMIGCWHVQQCRSNNNTDGAYSDTHPADHAAAVSNLAPGGFNAAV